MPDKTGCGNRALWNTLTMTALGQIPGMRTPRAIVIMSSAKEGSAGEEFEKALAAARGSGIPVFFVRMMPEQFDDRVNPLLVRVARETGGRCLTRRLWRWTQCLKKMGLAIQTLLPFEPLYAGRG